MSSDPEKIEADFDKAMELSDVGVSRFYANGFSILSTASDVTILFRFNGAGNALCSLSYPVAKDLLDKLSMQVVNFEKAVGAPILPSDSVVEKLMKFDFPNSRVRTE